MSKGPEQQLHKTTSRNSCAFFYFEQKIFSRVVRTAFYVTEGQFEINFSAQGHRLMNNLDLSKKMFTPLAKQIRLGCPNCILRVQWNNLGKVLLVSFMVLNSQDTILLIYPPYRCTKNPHDFIAFLNFLLT